MLVFPHILVQCQGCLLLYPGIIKNQLGTITLNDTRQYLLHFRHIPSFPRHSSKRSTYHDKAGKINSLLFHVALEFCRFLFGHVQPEISGHYQLPFSLQGL